jgi:GTPase
MAKPVLAIVGRPNVGKSALFNRICGKQISLVYDRPGVTRDRLSMETSWENKPFTLIDTGGVGLDDQSGFEEAIQREVNIALETASEILFVVDGRSGLTPLDESIARRLRKTSKRMILVVNKLDTDKQIHAEQDFARLGFTEVFGVSAAHGRGVEELMRAVSALWDEKTEAAAHRAMQKIRVAVVGRPNVGKSSLLNALIEEERLIVSPVAGTTRDAVDVDFVLNGLTYQFVDTAGMRKKARVQDELEQAMASRTAHSINRAHVCLLVLDAAEGIAVQEKKIAALIQDAHKPCLILVNKWDLTKDTEKKPGQTERSFREIYEIAVREEFFFLEHAPMVFVSAKEGSNMKILLKKMELVAKNRTLMVPTGELNRVVKAIMLKHSSPVKKGKILKIYYISQQRDEVGTPTLMAFINDRDLWTESYQRYLEQNIRKTFPWEGCPIRWVLKDKKDAPVSAKREQDKASQRPKRGPHRQQR